MNKILFNVQWDNNVCYLVWFFKTNSLCTELENPKFFQVETICIYNSKIDNDSSINNVHISPVTSGSFMQKSFKT